MPLLELFNAVRRAPAARAGVDAVLLRPGGAKVRAVARAVAARRDVEVVRARLLLRDGELRERLPEVFATSLLCRVARKCVHAGNEWGRNAGAADQEPSAVLIRVVLSDFDGRNGRDIVTGAILAAR